MKAKATAQEAKVTAHGGKQPREDTTANGGQSYNALKLKQPAEAEATILVERKATARGSQGNRTWRL